MTRPTYNGMNVDEYARHYVKDMVDRGQTVRQAIEGQHGRYGFGLRHQIGGGFTVLGTDERVQLSRHELIVQIGDEWKVFNLHDLFEEAKWGATQATLL